MGARLSVHAQLWPLHLQAIFDASPCLASFIPLQPQADGYYSDGGAQYAYPADLYSPNATSGAASQRKLKQQLRNGKAAYNDGTIQQYGGEVQFLSLDWFCFLLSCSSLTSHSPLDTSETYYGDSMDKMSVSGEPFHLPVLLPHTRTPSQPFSNAPFSPPPDIQPLSRPSEL
jgi:hypothetical protein